jgi:hypothetical protein
VLLRDVLLRSGPAFTTERGARTSAIEAIASDGYRAVFRWGEVFSSPAGEQVLVITTQDGKRLDDAAGPLALRALGVTYDPGPGLRAICAHW